MGETNIEIVLWIIIGINVLLLIGQGYLFITQCKLIYKSIVVEGLLKVHASNLDLIIDTICTTDEQKKEFEEQIQKHYAELNKEMGAIFENT